MSARHDVAIFGKFTQNKHSSPVMPHLDNKSPF